MNDMARSLLVAFAALTAAATLVLQSGAGAQAAATWHAEPSSGPPGTGVVVGANRPGETPCPNAGDVAHVRMIDPATKTTIAETFINTDDLNGNIWEDQFDVPADAAPGDYTLTADCAADEAAPPDLTYADLAFTVTAPNAGTTTTTTSPGNLKPPGVIPPAGDPSAELAAGPGPAAAPSVTVPAASVQPAPAPSITPVVASTPAQAVVQQPNFTG
jgi:hypothetical protein